MRLVVPIAGAGTRFFNIHVEFQPKRLGAGRMPLDLLGHPKFSG
jgi:hypothetical protein